MSINDPMPCWIYRSGKKEEMYLYAASEDGLDELPEELMKMFGSATLVMQLDLHEERTLARVDVAVVMAALKENGYYLQMPPTLVPDLYHGNED